jgi:hypothetical protein
LDDLTAFLLFFTKKSSSPDEARIKSRQSGEQVGQSYTDSDAQNKYPGRGHADALYLANFLSRFSGLLTRVEIGHIRMGLAGNGRIKPPAEPADVVARRQDQRHSIVNFGHELVGVGRDDREGANPLA